MPAIALAHPLGNFTINHYAGVRIEPDRILLDVVVDQAEIPTFQARLAFDTDGDGEVSDEEADAGRISECETLASSLELVVGDTRQPLTLTHAGLTFPHGVGGLSTMRLVCEYRADLATPIATATGVTFADTSFPERLGWREIVTTGSGVMLSATTGSFRETGTSERLTAYPTDQLAQAPADTRIDLVVTPGGTESMPAGATAAGSGGSSTAENPTIWRGFPSSSTVKSAAVRPRTGRRSVSRTETSSCTAIGVPLTRSKSAKCVAAFRR